MWSSWSFETVDSKRFLVDSWASTMRACFCLLDFVGIFSFVVGLPWLVGTLLPPELRKHSLTLAYSFPQVYRALPCSRFARLCRLHKNLQLLPPASDGFFFFLSLSQSFGSMTSMSLSLRALSDFVFLDSPLMLFKSLSCFSTCRTIFQATNNEVRSLLEFLLAASRPHISFGKFFLQCSTAFLQHVQMCVRSPVTSICFSGFSDSLISSRQFCSQSSDPWNKCLSAFERCRPLAFQKKKDASQLSNLCSLHCPFLLCVLLSCFWHAGPNFRPQKTRSGSCLDLRTAPWTT